MKVKQYWVARDRNGRLYLYDNCPTLVGCDYFLSYLGSLWDLPTELFPSLTFENSPKRVVFTSFGKKTFKVTLLDKEDCI